MLTTSKLSPVHSITGVINTYDKNVSCIARGIDNIYLTVAINKEFYDEVIKKIGDSEIVNIFDFKFNVGPCFGNTGGYGKLLKNKYLRILITNEFCEEMPNIKIIINSIWLHTADYLEIMEYITKNFGDFTIKTNRIDIYSDIQGLNLNDIEIDNKDNGEEKYIKNSSCKANLSNLFPTGFNIGKRSNKTIFLRIYNKRKELNQLKNKGKDKDWLYEIWNKNGYKKNKTVFRIEYELGRKFLKQSGFNYISDIYDLNLSRLWEYLTKWFRLVEIDKNKNKSRSKTNKKWEFIQKVFEENKEGKIIRAYPEVNGKMLEDKFKKLLMKYAAYSYESPGDLIIRTLREINNNEFNKYDDIYNDFINKRDMERFNDRNYQVPF